MDVDPFAVQAAFRALIADPAYPCLGAKSALHRDTYRLGLYTRLGHDTTALAAGLDAFVMAQDRTSSVLSSFGAVFMGETTRSHEALAEALWRQLHLLHEGDMERWEEGYSPDPRDPHFAFSFAGMALFVVGLWPDNPRRARRFPWPALIFNPHYQFKGLRARGHFTRIVERIRARDLAYDGCPNPTVADYGTVSEAIQYAGALPSDDLLRPFTHGRP